MGVQKWPNAVFLYDTIPVTRRPVPSLETPALRTRVKSSAMLVSWRACKCVCPCVRARANACACVYKLYMCKRGVIEYKLVCQLQRRFFPRCKRYCPTGGRSQKPWRHKQKTPEPRFMQRDIVQFCKAVGAWVPPLYSYALPVAQFCVPEGVGSKGKPGSGTLAQGQKATRPL